MGMRDNAINRFDRILLLAFFTFGIILCCGLGYWLPQWHNNQRLQRFANNLYNYPLPPRTTVVKRQADVGLMGNGNHCDFVVEQGMTSKLSREEIETFYRDVAIIPVDNDSKLARNGFVSVHLSFSNNSLESGQTYFTLKVVDIGYPPGFDIRCH